MPYNFLGGTPPTPPAAPRRYNFFGPPEETPFERWMRENRERMEAAGALPTEEMPALPTEAKAGTFLGRVGKDIASGTLGAASLATQFSPARVVPEALFGESPVGWLSEVLAGKSRQLQETPDPSWLPGEGQGRGPLSERYIEEVVGSGGSPLAAATGDTLSAALGLADPTDLIPGGAAVGALGGLARLFRRGKPAARAAEEALPVAAKAVPEGGVVDVAEEFLKSLGRGPEQDVISVVDDPLEAMAHAASASSPEAMSRIAGGTRFYQVSPGGEVIPMIGVDAVDAAPKKGYAKVRVSANGEIITEQGQLTEAGRRSLGDLPSGRAVSPLDEPAAPGRAIGSPGTTTPPAASESPLPFQYNLRERFGLDEESATAMEDIIRKDLPAYQAQRRAGGPTNQEVSDAVESLASANGLTKKQFMEAKPGTVYNREELMVLDSMVERRRQDVSDIARRLDEARAGNLADVDRLQLEQAAAIMEHNALLRASVGASSETARTLQSRQQIIRAIKKCFGGG